MVFFLVPTKTICNNTLTEINLTAINNGSSGVKKVSRNHQLVAPRKPNSLSIPKGICANPYMTKTSSGAQWVGEGLKGLAEANSCGNLLVQLQKTAASAVAVSTSSQPGNEFDIMLLREKSKHLDLPLISALCNDRSLLKQTKILGTGTKSGTASSMAATAGTVKEIAIGTTAETNAINGIHFSCTGSTIATASAATAKLQSQPGMTSVGNGGKTRKTSISHRHPNDKLPPLPVQMAEANNYVMDPAILKHHKGFNNSNNGNNNNSNNNTNNNNSNS